MTATATLSAAPPAARGEFGRGWKVLLASLVGVTCGASPIPFNTIGFAIGPIHAETGWSFAEISFGFSIFGIVAALLAPVYGWLADRHGVRIVAIGSTVAFAATFAGVGLTQGSVGSFYFAWLLVGLVGIGSTPVTWSRAVNLWFVKNRGLALGVMLLGTSLAALTIPRLAVWAIGQFGWRGMYFTVALVPLLVAVPVALAWFREPTATERPASLAPDGVLTGMTLGEALRSRRFWTLWLSIAMVALAYGGAHIHMPQIILQHGMGAGEAAGVMGMIGLAIMAGRLVTGWLFDRIWAPLVCVPILLVPAFGCSLLLGTGASAGSVTLAAVMLGFAAGAESDVIAFLASRYFGLAHYGKLYGMLYMPFGVASAISPVLYGRVHDLTGSYDGMLKVAMGLFAGGALLLLSLGRYPDFSASRTETPT